MKHNLKFKAWDSNLNQIITDLEEYYISINHSNELKIGVFDADDDYYELQPLRFTGFKDCQKNDIYEGDILSDEVMTYEGLKQSEQQVFWDEKQGCWMLDFSFSQNKSASDLLSMQLAAYNYSIVGNIYQKQPLKQTS